MAPGTGCWSRGLGPGSGRPDGAPCSPLRPLLAILVGGHGLIVAPMLIVGGSGCGSSRVPAARPRRASRPPASADDHKRDTGTMTGPVPGHGEEIRHPLGDPGGHRKGRNRRRRPPCRACTAARRFWRGQGRLQSRHRRRAGQQVGRARLHTPARGVNGPSRRGNGDGIASVSTRGRHRGSGTSTC